MVRPTRRRNGVMKAVCCEVEVQGPHGHRTVPSAPTALPVVEWPLSPFTLKRHVFAKQFGTGGRFLLRWSFRAHGLVESVPALAKKRHNGRPELAAVPGQFS